MSVTKKNWIEVFGVEPESPEPILRLNKPGECDHCIKNPDGWGFIPCNRKDTTFQGGHWLCEEHWRD